MNGISGQAHGALDRGAKILRPYRRDVGEVQPAAQPEGVGAPAVARQRNARGEVGDQRATADPGNAAVGDEAVIGERERRRSCVSYAGSMQLHSRPRTRSGLVAPRPAAVARARAVAAVQTEPPATVSAAGALPSAIRRLTVACAGRCG